MSGWDCSKCGNKAKYSPTYDSVLCPSCDEWMEKNCGDDDCTYCKDRPKKPSEVKDA